MARIRTIKPEFWTDEKLALLTPVTRLVFLGLVSQADDAGRLVDNVKLLDGMLFPYTDDSCEGALDELAASGRVIRYRSKSGQPLIQVANWEKHQKVQKPSKYTLPAPTAGIVQQSPGESPESPRRVPVSDLGPTTPDLRPPTADPCESEPEPAAATAGAVEAERYTQAVQLEAYADEHGYGPRDRLIAIGEDITAWRTPTGAVVPQDDRLRLLKLADAHLAEPGSKAHDRRSALKYVIAQQFDPFTIQKAADRPSRQPEHTPAPASTSQPVTAAASKAKNEESRTAYDEWRKRIQERFDAEPADVRKALEDAAQDAIGEIGRRLPEPARQRTIAAKVLALYGERIGVREPGVAA